MGGDGPRGGVGHGLLAMALARLGFALDVVADDGAHAVPV